MISNSQIKAAWIDKLKTTSAITTVVPAIEIREDDWKGTDFSYPNIRVKLSPLSPTNTSVDCMVFSSEVTILIFSEEKSSKQADDIASVVAGALWGRGFTSNGVKVSSVHLSSLEPATVPERDTNSWQSAVVFRTMIQS